MSDTLYSFDGDPDFSLGSLLVLSADVLDFEPFVDQLGSILSLSPADGSQLSTDPNIARFTPIVAQTRVRVGESLIAYAVLGTLSWVIFDGKVMPTSDVAASSTSFAPLFREHSTIRRVDDDIYETSIIPNGGWWRSNVEIEYVSGLILAQA